MQGGRSLSIGPFSFCLNPFIVWRCLPISSMEHQINEEIRDKEVRLISDDGQQLGIVPIQQAQEAAVEKGMDLVKIAPQAKPPVCKIMDYGKFRFEQQKKQKEMKKNSKVVSLKETQLSPTIDVHDKNVKLKRTIKMLEAGDKVKVAVRFRGRQLAHIDIGQKILEDFVAECADYCIVEKPAKMEGRTLIAILAPKKK